MLIYYPLQGLILPKMTAENIQCNKLNTDTVACKSRVEVPFSLPPWDLNLLGHSPSVVAFEAVSFRYTPKVSNTTLGILSELIEDASV